jgi:BirA family biotin operon repressor/biotin-[acetyl-CoA-carboxylase] ligase
MDLGWELLRGGLFPPFSSMTALSQTQGRGRHGRVWQSPPGNLYASLRLPEKPPYRGTIAPLALTFELSAALEDLSGVETFIKWPNDLIFSGKKAGGVLLENRGGNVIAGIGLNLLKAPEVERDPAAPKPGALPLTDPPEALWLDLSKRLHLRYNRLNGASGAFREDSYLKSLERRLHRLGEPALLKDARTAAGEAFPELRGIILGLDISGALLLEIPSGVVALTGGSLLMKEPDPSGSLHP